MSSLNSRERDATLIDFPLEENSKLAPKASRRTSSSRVSSSYTNGIGNIGLLIYRISAKQTGVTENRFGGKPYWNILVQERVLINSPFNQQWSISKLAPVGLECSIDLNKSRSYTPVEKQVLFNFSEGSSTSIIGSFPLLQPPFTAKLLNGDICI